MNNKAVEILNHFINYNEDYQKVSLTENQYKELENKCCQIPILDENWIWDETEITFHTYIINLGYKQNENNFQWEL